jgi:cytochrome c2
VRSRRVAVAIAIVVLLLGAAAAAFFVWQRGQKTQLRERAITAFWQADGPSVRPRREPCVTCHDAHPKAEGLVAKHPTATYGCTSCHGGEGTLESPHPRVVLKDTGDGKTKAWVTDGIDPLEHREPLLRLGAPMPDLPPAAPPWTIAEGSRDAFLASVPEVQGGCFKCHSADEALSGAPELARGRTLFRDLGCQACHAVARLSPLPKPGAPLSDLAQRMLPGRVLAYLRDPKAVDPGARMPASWPAGIDDAARRDDTIAIAAFLFERSERLARDGKGKEVARAAVVAGANAEDGKLFYEAYGCKGCHDDAPAPRSLAPSLAAAGDAWTEDWLAAFSREPKALHAGARMPSLRLSAREAASIAKYLASRHGSVRAPPEDVLAVTDPARRSEHVKCSAGGSGGDLSRTQCGELLVVRHACVACHDIDGVEAPASAGPSLDGFAARARLSGRATLAKLDAPRMGDPNARMPDHDLSLDELRALMVFLAGLGDAQPLAAFDVAERPERRVRETGRGLVRVLGCPGCHTAGRMRGVPPLVGEGARARPEWVFSMLDHPERNGVRPELHPEWIYGELVPPAKLAPRMPSFGLTPVDATTIARLFTLESSASFPFAPPRPASLTPEERVLATTALNTQCLACHYVGELPRERAKTAEHLAAGLSGVHLRRRDTWLRVFLPGHVKAPLPPKLADFVLLLREGTVLPRAGEEARVPVLGLGE